MYEQTWTPSIKWKLKYQTHVKLLICILQPSIKFQQRAQMKNLSVLSRLKTPTSGTSGECTTNLATPPPIHWLFKSLEIKILVVPLKAFKTYQLFLSKYWIKQRNIKWERAEIKWAQCLMVISWFWKYTLYYAFTSCVLQL
jgi:hypothetical protein